MEPNFIEKTIKIQAELANWSPYRQASSRLRPASTSIITYILVHEREVGLIGT